MLFRILSRRERIISLLVIAATFTGIAIAAKAAQQPEKQKDESATAAARWESPARLHRSLDFRDRGILVIDAGGVQFRPTKGHRLSWTFEEIHTAYVAPHRLTIKSWSNRSLHLPGEREYRFDLTEVVPAVIAASLARAIGRPSQNAIPDADADAPAIASIPARHRTLTRGTNGVLRFRRDGIDYVTASSGDSRSWRWADLQTLSNPDPYHLFIFGYRDTYTFDLKKALPRGLFDRMTDEIYSHSDEAPHVSASGPAVYGSGKFSSKEGQ